MVDTLLCFPPELGSSALSLPEGLRNPHFAVTHGMLLTHDKKIQKSLGLSREESLGGEQFTG